MNELVEGAEWLYEIKYDGVRALAIRDGGAVRIFGRSGLEATANYPEVVLALSKLPFARFVLDGEIIGFGPDGRPSFQALQRRIQAHDRGQIAAMALAHPAPYYVFDLLAFDRFDLRGLALETRKELLRRMIRDEGLLRYSDFHTGNGRAFYDAVAELGLEGVIAKRVNSPVPGRPRRRMAQNQVPARRAVRDRRMDRAGRLAHAFRRVAGRPVRGAGRAALRGARRHRL